MVRRGEMSTKSGAREVPKSGGLRCGNNRHAGPHDGLGNAIGGKRNRGDWLRFLLWGYYCQV